MALQPILLCGGEGVRLWPISRKNMPKQFIEFKNKKSLFELTLERAQKLKTNRIPIIITSNKFRYLIMNILKKLKIEAKLIFEPSEKNTTASIYFAAQFSKKNDVLLIMPSDHEIKDTKEFTRVMSVAKMDLPNDCWITFGIPPSNPSDAYGYIELKEKYTKLKNKNHLNDIISFIEKPASSVASKLLKTKKYLWNSGIFMGSKKVIINSIIKHAPEITISCEKVLKQTVNSENNVIYLNDDFFHEIQSKSIDYAVLENEPKIKCMQLDVEWMDVGSIDNFYNNKKYFIPDNNFIQIDGKNNIMPFHKRLIATIGVKNLMIVDTEDVTLITQKNRSEDLRELTRQVNIKNPLFLSSSNSDQRPWGRFEILLDNDICKVKQLTILPKNKISLQFHMKRSEHWLVVNGIASIYLDGKEFDLKKGESIDIKQESHHCIANNTEENLIVIEVQMGSYFGEDDIIRIDDPYKR